jgi:hypothetical protein
MTRHLLILTALVSSLPASAQADPEGGLVFLGWSKKGNLVALRSYSENFGIEHSCGFEAQIIDLVTDKVVWKKGDDWREGNRGGPDDDTPQCPGASAAWRNARPSIVAAMDRLGVVLAESREVKPFPWTSDGDSIDVKVVTANGKYEVRATSSGRLRGTKVISSGDLAEWGSTPEETAPSIVGWVASPDASRIAVVLQPACFYQMPCPTQVLVGCHVRVGFKAPAKK